MEAASGAPTSSLPSPGVSPVLLSDCMNELLFFTLSSFLDGTLEIDLPLSKDFVSRLLEDDRNHLQAMNADFCVNATSSDVSGVLFYPLYKRLGQAMGRCMNQGAFLSGSHLIVGPKDVDLFAQKQSICEELMVNVGSELANMYKAVDFELHVQEPFFSQLKSGLKTVEGRCAIGHYTQITSGALLLFNKCLLCQVQHVKWYNSFSKLLELEGLHNVLPGIKTISEGVQVYRKFYSETKEMSGGVLAISVSRLFSQPYLSIAKILAELNHEGINSLLSMVCTDGIIPDVLPPP